MITNSNKNETLFYKVFHNKYLFNLIFYHIRATEWVKYSDIRRINNENRKKFKEITSLDWLLKNKEYQLLKCKLEAKEYI
ncbi:hypothetical protein DICPUDRAFT_25175, partial [Dictyostelium purpureum]